MKKGKMDKEEYGFSESSEENDIPVKEEAPSEPVAVPVKGQTIDTPNPANVQAGGRYTINDQGILVKLS